MYRSPSTMREPHRLPSRAPRRSLILAAAGLALVSLGATIIVDDDGGTPDLATALGSAQPGDTVLVRPGTYVGSFEVPPQVDLVGSGPEQTILDGNGGGWTVGLSRGASVSGFTITGGENGVEALGGTRITGNVIESNGTATSGAGIRMVGCGVEVSANVIRDNTARIQGGGLFVFLAETTTCEATDPAPIITNNLVENNSAPRGAGLWVEDTAAKRQQWPTITQNTIVGNVADPGEGAVRFESTGEPWDLPVPTGRLTNNVIAGNPGGGVVNHIYLGDPFYSYGPPTSDNIFFGNGTPDLQSPDTAIGQDANVLADPGFRDPAGGDFRLQPGSPAIDAGVSLPGAAPADLRAFPRPLDGDLDGIATPDLGAYEETGEVANLTLAADTTAVSWNARTGATSYNLYRGDLRALLAGGDYTQDPGAPLVRLWCNLPAPGAIDDAAPPADEFFFYLATPAGPEEGALGFDALRQLRPNANPCP